LFQGRYKAILVDIDEYAKELSQYIHLNPVRAKMVKTPEEYEWSSYQRYWAVLILQPLSRINCNSSINRGVSPPPQPSPSRGREFL
jgi:hypothetical protein